jgi:hypothetical protein
MTALLQPRAISLLCFIQSIDCLTVIGPIHGHVDCSSFVKQIPCLNVYALPLYRTAMLNLLLATLNQRMMAAPFQMYLAISFVLGCLAVD